MSSTKNVPELLVRGDYHLLESPHWCPKRSLLYFVDITNRIVLSYDPRSKALKQIQV